MKKINSNTLYKKEVSAKGKVKYVPVREYSEEWHDSMPAGTHMVVIKPGMTSYSYNIDPAYAPLYAAFRMVREEFVAMLMAASEFRPKEEPLTDAEKEAWENMRKTFGEKFSVLYGPSYVDIVDKICDNIIKEADGLLQHESVKRSWENFQTIARLVK